jgi:hypothetical protein
MTSRTTMMIRDDADAPMTVAVAIAANAAAEATNHNDDAAFADIDPNRIGTTI